MVRSFAPPATREVLSLIEDYSNQHLDPEHLVLCKKMLSSLEMQPDSLLQKETPALWAGSIVHAVAAINFLFDKAHPLYISEWDLSKHFGLEPEQISQNSLWIRDVLSISHFDPEWSAPSLQKTLNDNLVMVDNYIVPMDVLPNKYQQMVRDARTTGADIVFETEGES